MISSKAVIRPPFKKFSKGYVLRISVSKYNLLIAFFSIRVAFFPLQIGDNVFIGEGSIVNAAVVSSYVYIGKNVVIVRYSTFVIK